MIFELIQFPIVFNIFNNLQRSIVTLLIEYSSLRSIDIVSAFFDTMKIDTTQN